MSEPQNAQPLDALPTLENKSLDELFETSPLLMSQDERKLVIEKLREARAAYVAKKRSPRKKAGPSGSVKVDFDDLDISL